VKHAYKGRSNFPTGSSKELVSLLFEAVIDFLWRNGLDFSTLGYCYFFLRDLTEGLPSMGVSSTLRLL
jgi:hypothetical protein